jgi:hypothetical protein
VFVRVKPDNLEYLGPVLHRKRHFLAALFGGGYGIKLDLR